MEKTYTPPFFTQVKEYLQTSVKLLKYQAIDTGASLISAILADLLFLFFLLSGFLFLSIALAALAANILHSLGAGTAAVAGIYAVATLCVPFLRKLLQNIFVRYLLLKRQTQRKTMDTRKTTS